MRINFRQGIVSTQPVPFLQINGSGNVDLLASNRPTSVTLAHYNTNYLYSDDNTVSDAWLGPFLGTENYWLYWDFNLLTFARTFGSTTLEPVAQSVEPGAGNAQITGVIAGGPGVGTFIVSEHYVLPNGRQFQIVGSTGNDGTYTVDQTIFDGNTGETSIIVNQTIPSAVADGEATLDIDAYGNALRLDGRHWFDVTNNVHYVLQGNIWREVLRVFAAQLVNGNTFIPQTIENGSFTGTQIGNTSSARAGRVIFDESSQPVRRDNGTFFNTEDQMFANASRVDAIRLESNVARAQFAFDNAVSEFTAVAWYEDGKARVAQYNDQGTTVVGMLTEDVLLNETGSVIIQGVVTNPNWNWTTGVDAVPVGSPLWIENGALVAIDPHVTDVVTYPIGRVPSARVLSVDTVVFEQGLGGKGDQGPPGSIEDIPPATTTELGGVTLTVPSSVPELAIVPSDQDPRLSDARNPLPHTHEADEVNFTPGAGIAANNVEGALLELGTEKVEKAGDTMLGFLTLNANPTAALHAAPKQYVDALVSGLVWLDPVCGIGLISDTETTPPVTPQFGDTYIIPPGATGAWSAIPAGHVVVWDGSTWIDRGTLVDINPDGQRFGISWASSTPAGGSFAGQENNIALFDNTGTLTGFEVPVTNNAAFVCNNSSLFAFNQYAFDGTSWVLFGGGSAIVPDNTTIVQNGNILSVKAHADGGTADAAFLEGNSLADLDLRYAAISHGHPASDVVVTPYTTSPNWGTSAYPTHHQLNSVNVQSALQEITDEKAPKQPYYADETGFPTAGNVEGMYAVSRDEDHAYAAISGVWKQLANNDGTVQDHGHNIPYDISYFVAGNILPSETIGSFLATRTIFIEDGAPGSLAVAEVAPSGPDVVLDIEQNGLQVGTITFTTGSTNGVIATTSAIGLSAGDVLRITSGPAASDPALRNVTTTLVGCAQALPCSLPEAPVVTLVAGIGYIDIGPPIPITGSPFAPPGSEGSVTVTGVYTTLLWELLEYSDDDGSSWNPTTLGTGYGQITITDVDDLIPLIDNDNGSGLWYRVRLTATGPGGSDFDEMILEFDGF